MTKPNAFTLDLSQLHNFDDDVTSDFNHQLAGIVQDVRNRTGCVKPRSVTLKLEAKPHESDPADVVITMTVASKIPAAKHIARKARSTPKNQLQLSFDRSDDLDI